MRIAIVGKLDTGANSVRTTQIRDFLVRNGYQVKIIDKARNSEQTATASSKYTPYKKYIPKFIRNILYLGIIGIDCFTTSRLLRHLQPDGVIFENETFAFCLIRKQKYVSIIDSPTPWVDEWNFSGDLSPFLYPILLAFERVLYDRADHLAFHWESYTSYVKKHIYDGPNITVLNWGCDLQGARAKYSEKPRVVFMGKLDGYWVNLELLSALSKLYEIDVYGAPPPSEQYRLNFKGYARPSVLADYQFGIITSTKDRLRMEGFSAKALDYLSYGLPTLTPEWRHDPALANYSIYYSEKNFLDCVRKYSSEEKWQALSDLCYDQARSWSWDNALRPLLSMLCHQGSQKPASALRGHTPGRRQ